MPTSEHQVRLPDRYRVIRHVADGGMAGVWAARDEVLGRLVAVKVLAPRLRRRRAGGAPLRPARRAPARG
jgi:serine/threonine-protein kinase